MSEIFSRNEMLWGAENQKILAQKHVIVVGLGGVGGSAIEALARAGIGEFTLIDFDTVSKSNLNRQIIALHSTIGEKKTALFKKRLKDINPDIKVNIFENFYTEELNNEIFTKNVDFVVDAIDTLKSKIQLLEYCHTNSLNVVTSFGAANRIDPTKLHICDISEIKDSKCPFTKNVLRLLNKKNIFSNIATVVSTELPYSTEKIKNNEKINLHTGEQIELTKVSPGSVSFVPPIAGYYMSFYIIKKILNL